MNTTTRKVVYTALFAALIFGATRISVPIPAGQGYIHLGDSLIYICAAMLPFPFCAIAAAIGGLLSDVTSGFAIWAPATFIIKFCMALFFTSHNTKLVSVHNSVAVIFAGVVNVLGYYLAECLIYRQDTIGKTLSAALASIPSNIGQSIGSAVLFFIIAFAFDKANIKRIISKDRNK